MKTFVAAVALVLAAISAASAGVVVGGDPNRPGYGDRADVNVGRIYMVEPRDSFVVVEFPFGQWYLPAEQRDLDRYLAHIGRDVVFDRDLRPLWDAPVPPPPNTAQ